MSIPSLWIFSCEVYQHEPLAQHCLKLQSTHNADICIMLSLAWLAEQHIEINADELQTLLIDTAWWRTEITTGLRAVRLLLASSAQMPAALHTDAKNLYEQIKQVELSSEHTTLNYIESQLSSFLKISDSSKQATDTLLQHNIGIYLILHCCCEEKIVQQTVRHVVLALRQ